MSLKEKIAFYIHKNNIKKLNDTLAYFDTISLTKKEIDSFFKVVKKIDFKKYDSKEKDYVITQLKERFIFFKETKDEQYFKSKFKVNMNERGVYSFFELISENILINDRLSFENKFFKTLKDLTTEWQMTKIIKEKDILKELITPVVEISNNKKRRL